MLFFTELSSVPCAEVPVDLESLPNVLRTRDVAILLDLSPDAVNDMARRGVLKGFKSGNQWRFRRKDVERYVEREKILAPPG
jgi:excisionase family DNA binding protein